MLDCTFLTRRRPCSAARAAQAEVVGIYCMVTMMEDCLWFARQLRSSGSGQLLVAGGPLPTCDPAPFLDDFDVVVLGEGEQTMLDLLRGSRRSFRFRRRRGHRLPKTGPETRRSSPRCRGLLQKNLDRIPFPARELLPNEEYIRYGRKKYGYSITTVMSTRGCPYRCEFCSNVVFGGSYRERSAQNVVDEIEEVLARATTGFPLPTTCSP